eukprot:7240253-Ditylum_brightwellii.AAC.1
MEASRSGGSQGMCSFNKMMRKHLSNPGSFPRHASGMLIIIVNSTKQCGYFGIYASPYDKDGVMKTWFYNTPQIGGHQRLLKKQLLKFPVLTEFPAYRVETAAILQYRNYTVSYRKACPCAANNMLGEWFEAIEMRNKVETKQNIGFYLANNCRLTLLAHPVGYYRDTFSDNSGDKIENKILLVSKDRSDQTSNVALGCGGSGSG